MPVSKLSLTTVFTGTEPIILCRAASLPQAEDHQERKHVFVQCDAMASRALQTEDGDGDGGIRSRRNAFQMHAAESV